MTNEADGRSGSDNGDWHDEITSETILVQNRHEEQWEGEGEGEGEI